MVLSFVHSNFGTPERYLEKAISKICSFHIIPLLILNKMAIFTHFRKKWSLVVLSLYPSNIENVTKFDTHFTRNRLIQKHPFSQQPQRDFSVHGGGTNSVDIEGQERSSNVWNAIRDESWSWTGFPSQNIEAACWGGRETVQTALSKFPYCATAAQIHANSLKIIGTRRCTLCVLRNMPPSRAPIHYSRLDEIEKAAQEN